MMRMRLDMRVNAMTRYFCPSLPPTAERRPFLVVSRRDRRSSLEKERTTCVVPVMNCLGASERADADGRITHRPARRLIPISLFLCSRFYEDPDKTFSRARSGVASSQSEGGASAAAIAAAAVSSCGGTLAKLSKVPRRRLANLAVSFITSGATAKSIDDNWSPPPHLLKSFFD